MTTRRAVVQGGRVIIEGLEDYPDGTVLEFDLVDSDEDDLSSEERRKLHEALDRSWAEAKAGNLRPARDVLDEL